MPIETEFKLKNGITLQVREAQVKDAGNHSFFLKKIGSQTDNMTFGNEVFPLEEVVNHIHEINKSSTSLMVLAFHEEKIVGCLTFNGNKRPRIEHTGFFGLSVLKEYWGLKMGSLFLELLINWAKESKVIRKINLKVREDNSRAIILYEKFDFKKEGLVTRDYLINGSFYNNILMGLDID